MLSKFSRNIKGLFFSKNAKKNWFICNLTRFDSNFHEIFKATNWQLLEQLFLGVRFKNKLLLKYICWYLDNAEKLYQTDATLYIILCYFIYNVKVSKNVSLNNQFSDWYMLIHSPVTWTNNFQPLFQFLLCIHRWNWWLPQAHYWNITLNLKRKER